MATPTDKYYELTDETKEYFDSVVSELHFPIHMNFKTIGDNKQKKLIKVMKVSPIWEFLTKSKVIVSINEELFDDLKEKEDLTNLLFKEELNCIEVDAEKDKIKIDKPNLNTYNSIVERYGFDKVKEAKDLEKSVLEQNDEKEKEEKGDVDVEFQ